MASPTRLNVRTSSKSTAKSSVKTSSRSRQRIQAACHELELAIADFENDDEAARRARAEAEKLRELKNQLLEIRRQLDQLS